MDSHKNLIERHLLLLALTEIKFLSVKYTCLFFFNFIISLNIISIFNNQPLLTFKIAFYTTAPPFQVPDLMTILIHRREISLHTNIYSFYLNEVIIIINIAF